MTFKGHLEDFPIVDVLQLLHLSRRSGSLIVEGETGTARLTLNDGYIIGANHPSDVVTVGKILLDMGAIDLPALSNAIHLQESSGVDRKPLVSFLISMGLIDKETGWKALERLIEETLVELTGLKQGTFRFEVGDVSMSDDFHHFPASLDPGLGLDIQEALMEVMQILDERTERPSVEPEPVDEHTKATIFPGQPASADEEGHVTTASAGEVVSKAEKLEEARHNLFDALDDEAVKAIIERGYLERKVILFSNDGILNNDVLMKGREAGMDVTFTSFEAEVLEQVATQIQRGVHPIIVIDINGRKESEAWTKRSVSLIKRLAFTYPGLSVISLGGPTSFSYDEVFRSGVRAILPRFDLFDDSIDYRENVDRTVNTLLSSIDGIVTNRCELLEGLTEIRRQLSSLKKRVQEIKTLGQSPEVSLVVLKFLSEFLDRCVIFLIRPNELIGLGAFGVATEEEDASTFAMNLRIALDEDSLVTDVIDNGDVFYGETDDLLLRNTLYTRIPAPKSQKIVLLPLRAADETVALIYADFGDKGPALLQGEALEILSLQAGLALELLLLKERRQTSPEPPSPLMGDGDEEDDRPQYH